MKTFKINQIAAAFILICLVTFTVISSVSAGVATVRELKGKVVYANDMTPVSGGVIEVFLYSDDEENGKMIERVNINSSGEFILTRINGNETDGIKIMCYPDDIQDNNSGFSREKVNLSDVRKISDKAYDIIIEVKRVGTDKKLD
ncbi:MAG TPA: hypothetical protein PKA90_09115 [Ignavibacteria bacterium]|nr:hypothetical protein [Ignavibacteria bacterium]HMR40576.1 hypothetical protein [Ignavibacteria bacterium]